MLENGFGTLVGGAIWGLAAGVVLGVARGGGPVLRRVTKGVMGTYIAVADSVKDAATEARAERDAHRTRATPTPPRATGEAV